MRRGSRRRHRLDSNHKAIELALRKCGWQTINLSSIGGACPDLLVQRNGQLRLVEVKSAEGQVTPEQMAFRLDGWPVVIVRSIEDALAKLAR